MYLAPLNYDRFFKKVFKNEEIAKSFLEDFFGKPIESIEPLPVKHKLTDAAAGVEFDYRCKIGGRYIIIEMQQWHKPDLIQRFYVYHTLSTGLQLERLPDKEMLVGAGKTKITKDYRRLEPVITLVWLVEDTLGNIGDYTTYSLSPEGILDFLRDTCLWSSPEHYQKLVSQRAKLLEMIDNTTLSIDFLSQNKLIFAYQENIIKNTSTSNQAEPNYKWWFDVADLTRNKSNKKTDFKAYLKNKTFRLIEERINKEQLVAEDYQYIEDYELHRENIERYNEGIYDDGKLAGKKEERRNTEKERKQKEAALLREEEALIREEEERRQKEEAIALAEKYKKLLDDFEKNNDITRE